MKSFNISQASKYCDVDQDTFTKWIDEGKIAADKSIGGHRSVKKEDVDRFLNENNMPIPDTITEDDQKKILVVDDDRIVVETIVQSLEEDNHGYDLISAADGFEAQAQIKRFKPDLLILDIMMPDINGYEVCKKIKSDEETKDIKIIVLSAYLDDENYEKMKEYGADACFSKPLPLQELRDEVAKMLF